MREIDFSRITREDLNAVYDDLAQEDDAGIDERPGRRLFDMANYERAVANADKAGEFEEQMTKVRDTTRNLMQCVMMDGWPRSGAIVDFGLDSQQHYESLYYPIRNDEIAPSVLDAAMGHGAKLTELVRAAPSNPHKDIEFYTSWDSLLGREKPEAPAADAAGVKDPALGESNLTAHEVKALAEEIQRDEHAARVRDYGEDDAATYEQRVREGVEPVQHLEQPEDRYFRDLAESAGMTVEELKEHIDRRESGDSEVISEQAPSKDGWMAKLGSIPKESVPWRGFLFSYTLANNRRFPTPVARGTTMCKCKPGPRRKAEKTAEQPRDRLAEIRAEIRDVQQQIETKRRDGRVIRTAKDFESLERAIAALTNQLAALLVAEATQAALDDSENRRQARSFAQGAGHTIKDQGRRDVTLRTACGPIIVRRPTSVATANAARPVKGCTRCS